MIYKISTTSYVWFIINIIMLLFSLSLSLISIDLPESSDVKEKIKLIASSRFILVWIIFSFLAFYILKRRKLR